MPAANACRTRSSPRRRLAPNDTSEIFIPVLPSSRKPAPVAAPRPEAQPARAKEAEPAIDRLAAENRGE
jgi:hypothetical protein